MTFAIIKSSDQCKNEKQKSKKKTVIKKHNTKSKMKIGKNSYKKPKYAFSLPSH